MQLKVKFQKFRKLGDNGNNFVGVARGFFPFSQLTGQ